MVLSFKARRLSRVYTDVPVKTAQECGLRKENAPKPAPLHGVRGPRAVCTMGCHGPGAKP